MQRSRRQFIDGAGRGRTRASEILKCAGREDLDFVARSPAGRAEPRNNPRQLCASSRTARTPGRELIRASQIRRNVPRREPTISLPSARKSPLPTRCSNLQCLVAGGPGSTPYISLARTAALRRCDRQHQASPAELIVEIASANTGLVVMPRKETLFVTVRQLALPWAVCVPETRAAALENLVDTLLSAMRPGCAKRPVNIAAAAESFRHSALCLLQCLATDNATLAARQSRSVRNRHLAMSSGARPDASTRNPVSIKRRPA